MQKVHQIYSGTVKLENGSATIIDDSKAQFIKTKFKECKIAIFYIFKEELALLKQVFGNRLTADINEFNNSDKNIALQICIGERGYISSKQILIFYNIAFQLLLIGRQGID